MSKTINLNMPLIAGNQNQKHITHNSALRVLDAIVQLSVKDRNLTTPPVSPINGDRYLVASGGSGDWSGWDGHIAAYQDNSWSEYIPKEGWLLWIDDENSLFVYDGSAWVDFTSGAISSPLSNGSFSLLGINGAVADTTNRFSINSPGVLFNHETDNFSITMNKASDTDNNEIYFQTGYSTRAIMGNGGDDNFSVKVSPNGSTFYQALSVDNGTGNIGIGTTADINNKLSVSGKSALFTNASGSFSFVFSKNATASDAAISLQSNYSTRALFGLLGDDNTTLKVSDDGSTYKIAAIVDKSKASVSLVQHPKFSGYVNYDNYIAADSWVLASINSTSHNDQLAFDTSTHLFTAPHDGYYMFSCGFRFKANAAVPSLISIGFMINGANPVGNRYKTCGEGSALIASYETYVNHSALIKLVSGATVGFGVYMVGNDGYILANENYFTGAQIP
jgi:hypothetical protein